MDDARYFALCALGGMFNLHFLANRQPPFGHETRARIVAEAKEIGEMLAAAFADDDREEYPDLKPEESGE